MQKMKANLNLNLQNSAQKLPVEDAMQFKSKKELKEEKR